LWCGAGSICELNISRHMCAPKSEKHERTASMDVRAHLPDNTRTFRILLPDQGLLARRFQHIPQGIEKRPVRETETFIGKLRTRGLLKELLAAKLQQAISFSYHGSITLKTKDQKRAFN